MKRASALTVSHLNVNYEKTTVLWDLSLDIPQGHLSAIVGPNGAGKSTLLKTILGQVRPLSGKIEFFDKPLKEMRNKIAYVPQKDSVDWDFPMTLLDLVLMGAYGRLGFCRFPGKKEKTKALELLRRVGLESFAKRQINELSGGQKQRAFIARALFQEADIFFMDEPFSGVDIASSEVIHQILIDLKNEGKSLFVVHHDLETVASTYDWVILLNTRLIASGTVSAVFTPEMINRTYGQEVMLLDRAVRLTELKKKGVI